MIRDEKATEFKDKVYRAITIAYAIEYLVIALGCLLIIVAIVLVILSKKKGFEVSPGMERLQFQRSCSWRCSLSLKYVCNFAVFDIMLRAL